MAEAKAGLKQAGGGRRGSASRERMLDAADQLINTGLTPDISMREVAEMAGASRALVYAYFPDRLALLNAVIERQAEALEQAGIVTAAGSGSLAQRAHAASRLYLLHIAAHDRTMELVIRDPAIARQIDGRLARLRGRVYRALARAMRTELRMAADEAVALVQLLAAIPEEAGQQVRAGVLDLAAAISLSDRLLDAALAAQAPRPQST